MSLLAAILVCGLLCCYQLALAQESTQDYQKPTCDIHGQSIPLITCEAKQPDMYVTVNNELQYPKSSQLVDYDIFMGKKCVIDTTCGDSCPERCTRLILELKNQVLLKGANVSVCVLHGDGNDTKNDCIHLDLTSITDDPIQSNLNNSNSDSEVPCERNLTLLGIFIGTTTILIIIIVIIVIIFCVYHTKKKQQISRLNEL